MGVGWGFEKGDSSRAHPRAPPAEPRDRAQRVTGTRRRVNRIGLHDGWDGLGSWDSRSGFVSGRDRRFGSSGVVEWWCVPGMTASGIRGRPRGAPVEPFRWVRLVPSGSEVRPQKLNGKPPVADGADEAPVRRLAAGPESGPSLAVPRLPCRAAKARGWVSLAISGSDSESEPKPAGSPCQAFSRAATKWTRRPARGPSRR